MVFFKNPGGLGLKKRVLSNPGMKGLIHIIPNNISSHSNPGARIGYADSLAL